MLVVSLCLVFLSQSRNQNAIIIYSAMEQFRNDELQKQLNERFPDKNVYVMYNSTAKTAARISVEKEKTDADRHSCRQQTWNSTFHFFFHTLTSRIRKRLAAITKTMIDYQP